MCVSDAFHEVMKKKKDKKIEQLRKALFEYKNVVDNYSSHLFGCNIDKTDFCTCGLKEAKDRVREALKDK